MNSDVLKGKWLQMKGKVRTQWGKLTDDELDQINGNTEQLVGLLQERYGYEKDRAERELNSFLDREAHA